MYGKNVWLIADGFMSDTEKGELVSHEAVCVLNLSGETAHIDLTLYFEDCEPMTGFHAECGARRTHHIRMDKLLDEQGNHVPMGKPYAALVVSSVPIVVQYSRIDTTQVNETLATTMAY